MAPDIPVADQFLVENNAQGKAGLHSETAGAPSLGGIASGKDQAEARREGDAGVSASHQLVPVVQENIADADSGAGKGSGVQSHQRVTELVAFIPGNRPFLGEGVVPVFAVPEAGEAGNVLHHAEILVVGLLHQKAVVLDAGFGSGRRVLLAQASWR